MVELSSGQLMLLTNAIQLNVAWPRAAGCDRAILVTSDGVALADSRFRAVPVRGEALPEAAP